MRNVHPHVHATAYSGRGQSPGPKAKRFKRIKSERTKYAKSRVRPNTESLPIYIWSKKIQRCKHLFGMYICTASLACRCRLRLRIGNNLKFGMYLGISLREGGGRRGQKKAKKVKGLVVNLNVTGVSWTARKRALAHDATPCCAIANWTRAATRTLSSFCSRLNPSTRWRTLHSLSSLSRLLPALRARRAAARGEEELQQHLLLAAQLQSSWYCPHGCFPPYGVHDSR